MEAALTQTGEHSIRNLQMAATMIPPEHNIYGEPLEVLLSKGPDGIYLNPGNTQHLYHTGLLNPEKHLYKHILGDGLPDEIYSYVPVEDLILALEANPEEQHEFFAGILSELNTRAIEIKLFNTFKERGVVSDEVIREKEARHEELSGIESKYKSFKFHAELANTYADSVSGLILGLAHRKSLSSEVDYQIIIKTIRTVYGGKMPERFFEDLEFATGLKKKTRWRKTWD